MTDVFLNHGWEKNVIIRTDEQGVITDIEQEASSDTSSKQFHGPVIPGFVNAHSHAFQYLMAGLAEDFKRTDDDFWSWRNYMYKIALGLDPDEMQVVARMLYSEMLRMGYTHVTEFHYLHRDKEGNSYSNPAEMGERLVAAATETGIHITLVPVMYAYGGFGSELNSDQRRFNSPGLSAYVELLDASKKATQGSEFAHIGFGAHSIRAVHAEQLYELGQMKDRGPFHIHIAEQLKEVHDCLDFYGKRPVQFLSEQVDLDENHNLVHATHLDDAELDLISGSGASVVLCPSTEGNLGDGIFRFDEFIAKNGSFSIGSDSQVGLNPTEELRWLEYQQRLTKNKRSPLGALGRTADLLYLKSRMGGAIASGISNGFQVGNSFDALVLNNRHPLLSGADPEKLLSYFIYSGEPGMIGQVITKGKTRVLDGQHISQEKILEDWKKLNNTFKLR